MIDQKIENTRRILQNLVGVPEGSLTYEVRDSHNLYYYLRLCKKGKQSKRYLGKGNNTLVSGLKAKRYYTEKMRRLEHNHSVLLKAADSLIDDSDEAVYDAVPASYMNLPPECYVDERYEELKEWAKEYERNPYPIPVDANTACDGTKTRSKGETIIYDDVLCSGIPNQYDPKIRRLGASGVYHNLYPDFLSLGFDGT